MPYKIADRLPSPRATTVELADFIEIECLKTASLKFSHLSAIKSMDIPDDYQEDDVDEDDFVRDNVEEKRIDNAFDEIELRYKYSGKKYPFFLNKELVETDFANISTSIIYIYLLLSTRLKMGGKNIERSFNNIDGTLLFEKLCKVVLSNFWGNRSHSILFGTSASGGFSKKVEELIIELKEGGSYKSKDGVTPSANDDNLDVVVWNGFRDERCSQLIGFAQCKTGDSWREDLGQLNPGIFVQRWFSDSPCVEPTNVFMVSDIVRDEFYTITAGLLFFDRCRIMDYLPDNIDDYFLSEIKLWLKGAASKYNLNIAHLL